MKKSPSSPFSISGRKCNLILYVVTAISAPLTIVFPPFNHLTKFYNSPDSRPQRHRAFEVTGVPWIPLRSLQFNADKGI